MVEMAQSVDTSEKQWIAFVAGHHNIQKGLLASFLEREFDFRCNILEDGSDFPPVYLSGDYYLFLLRDCYGENADDIISYVDFFGDRLLNDDRLCVGLINLLPGLDIGAEMFNRGVRGILENEASTSVMYRFVKSLLQGELWFPRQLVSRCILENRGKQIAGSEDDSEAENSDLGLEEILPAELSPREKEVLLQIGLGATNDQIADRLCISQHTVKSHIYRIFRKINVPNRLQAALWASKFLS